MQCFRPLRHSGAPILNACGTQNAPQPDFRWNAKSLMHLVDMRHHTLTLVCSNLHAQSTVVHILRNTHCVYTLLEWEMCLKIIKILNCLEICFPDRRENTEEKGQVNLYVTYSRCSCQLIHSWLEWGHTRKSIITYSNSVDAFLFLQYQPVSEEGPTNCQRLQPP